MAMYTVILSPDPDVGGFSASCPAMPGALSQGASRESALAAMQRVMDAWLDIAREYGESPLAESPRLIADHVASVLEDRDEAGWDNTIETSMVAPAEPILA